MLALGQMQSRFALDSSDESFELEKSETRSEAGRSHPELNGERRFSVQTHVQAEFVHAPLFLDNCGRLVDELHARLLFLP
jgi:hypothetical protein